MGLGVVRVIFVDRVSTTSVERDITRVSAGGHRVEFSLSVVSHVMSCHVTCLVVSFRVGVVVVVVCCSRFLVVICLLMIFHPISPHYTITPSPSLSALECFDSVSLPFQNCDAYYSQNLLFYSFTSSPTPTHPNNFWYICFDLEKAQSKADNQHARTYPENRGTRSREMTS